MLLVQRPSRLMVSSSKPARYICTAAEARLLCRVMESIGKPRLARLLRRAAAWSTALRERVAGLQFARSEAEGEGMKRWGPNRGEERADVLGGAPGGELCTQTVKQLGKHLDLVLRKSASMIKFFIACKETRLCT